MTYNVRLQSKVYRKMSNLFAIDFNVGNIILKNSWHIDFRKLILAEDDQQTSFSTCTITNYYQLLSDCSHCSSYLNNKQ